MDGGGVTLLLDHNLSPRLVGRLRTPFPGSAHVQDRGLERAGDAEVWTYARDNGFVIVTKDSDFNDLSLALGAPPKVVWLRIGNCTLDDAERALRSHQDDLRLFDADETARVFVIRRS